MGHGAEGMGLGAECIALGAGCIGHGAKRYPVKVGDLKGERSGLKNRR